MRGNREVRVICVYLCLCVCVCVCVCVLVRRNKMKHAEHMEKKETKQIYLLCSLMICFIHFYANAFQLHFFLNISTFYENYFKCEKLNNCNR